MIKPLKRNFQIYDLTKVHFIAARGNCGEWPLETGQDLLVHNIAVYLQRYTAFLGLFCLFVCLFLFFYFCFALDSPSFNVALINKMSQLPLWHHCVLQSESAEFIDMWLSDTYEYI